MFKYIAESVNLTFRIGIIDITSFLPFQNHRFFTLSALFSGHFFTVSQIPVILAYQQLVGE
jgi:hypothetical protein